MKLRYLIFLPCFVFCIVSVFFFGSNSISTVNAADTTISFTCTSGGRMTYSGTNTGGTINNPDYLAKVVVTIRNVGGPYGTIIASTIATINNATASNNSFSITGPFTVNTWYYLEAATPTFANILFTCTGTNYTINGKGGYFQYSANLNINFTYAIAPEQDVWFTQIVTS